jgi:serine/threonine-protein kinase HipA
VSESRDEVGVHLNDLDLGDVTLGWLRREGRSGKSVISFEFSTEWLERREEVVLDPSLGLYQGSQYFDLLPGIFSDTAPDRWGRYLLERREAALARRQSRRPRRLDDWDFLVAVSDELRMGALRLVDGRGQYVSSDQRSIPPLARLAVVQNFAQRAERGEALAPKDEDEEIALLVAPGASLGGARPKANFLADDGTLWIAKFPSRNDRRDSGAWEYVLNRLAAAGGITVPQCRLLDLTEGPRTFAAKRFDRSKGDRRLFASAMTLTGKQDHEKASYLDVAQSITRYGSRIRSELDQDLEELFRRVAFNVMTAHRDDHLRNHGFLITKRGWRLSPAFDLNPVPELKEHTLALDEANPTPDLELVRASAPYYRIQRRRAEEILLELRNAVNRWREVARETGIHRDEAAVMADAFVGD